MTKILLNPTKQTPEVNFNFDEADFVIKGCSRPEDVELFYGPLIMKIEEHKTVLLNNSQKLKIKVHIVYFNSSSLKFLLELLRVCVLIKGPNDVYITWISDKDDEDVLEVGHELSEALNVIFEFVEL